MGSERCTLAPEKNRRATETQETPTCTFLHFISEVIFAIPLVIFSPPQQAAGLVLTETELMTGLPEYRNGGLLLDMGLLEAKHPGVTGQAHGPEEEVGVVCW